MSNFARVNPPGWGSFAKLLSTQMNQLDLDHSQAVNSTGGNISGTITMSGAGSVAGTVGSITATSPATMTGLTSLNANMVGLNITIPNATSTGNNGTFSILTVNELAGSITYSNGSAVAPDANNGAISWSILIPAAEISIGNVGARIEAFVPLALVTNIDAGIVSFAGNGGIALCGGSQDYPTYSTISGGAVVSSPRSFARALPIVLAGSELGPGWTTAAGGTNILKGPGTSVAQIFTLPSMWNGATVASLSMALIVASGHSLLPSQFPEIQFFRTPIGAGSTFSLQSLSTFGTQVFPTPANVSAYIDGGLTQLLTFACNQNNVIDSTQYVYYVSITDENGGGAVSGNAYVGMIANYTTANMAPQ
jgi:hypothetical protein